ncbi:ADP-ribosylglycohydrolase family protein [Sulfurovum sp.]|uniref:ADP-ribosylglycohydrolase family protein n=1 Tax=Sulfurovum sp. TaxID=1969726 RepID=UPI002867EE1C|nr:ADP-ribosylglycohydrolase family protein [Sulfurovum sp.]
MHDTKVTELLLATLAADTYCLGSHWVYDEDELKSLAINWEELNVPHVSWHEGKGKGDLTHYGDQIVILYDFLKDKTSFSIEEYMQHWRKEMHTFKGYIDGSTKTTIENIDKNLLIPCGSNSGDMSIIGKITPLLKVSNSKEEFLTNTKLLAQATHNNEEVLEAMDFFANLLLDILEGKEIRQSILQLKEGYSQKIQNYIESGLNTKDDDTYLAISKFGSACPTEFCFPSTIHLLFKYDNYKEALIENAKAGGDSSARAMIIAYLLTAQNSIDIVPQQWLVFNT